MILGGDQAWTRRVTTVSTCPQVGSMFNEGFWNAQTMTWAIRRTIEGDEAHYTAFLFGAPFLQAAGTSMRQILKLPRAWVVLGILHLTMAMGRLLGEFVDGDTRGGGGSPFRSVKTCKFPCWRGVQVGAFMRQLPLTRKKRPTILRYGRILQGALASGRARPEARPPRA